MRSLRSTLLLVGLLGPLPAASAQQPVSQMESPIVAWTNQVRQQNGRGPVQVNYRLSYAARLHAYAMAQREQMAHNVDGSTFVDRAKMANYAYQFIGENVAYNEGFPNPAWKFCEGWMNSPSHWQNIQNPVFTEIGVGVYRSEAGKYYACQLFGTPAGPSGMMMFPTVSLPRQMPRVVEAPVAAPEPDSSSVTATPPTPPVVTAPEPPVITPPSISTPTAPGVTVSPQTIAPHVYPLPGQAVQPMPLQQQFPTVPGQVPGAPQQPTSFQRNLSIPRGQPLAPAWEMQHPDYYVHPWRDFPGW